MHSWRSFIKKVPDHGICFQEQKAQWCNVVDWPSSSTGLSDAHYLFLASGSAGERLVYGSYCETGAQADKSFFAAGTVPDFEQRVAEADVILKPYKFALEKLKAALIERFKQVRGVPTALPKVVHKNIEYHELLSNQGLEDELKKIGLAS
jgi:hypothetical protein